MPNVRDVNFVSDLRAKFSAVQSSGSLPDDVNTAIEGLFETLASPVKVSLLGLPKSGKSQVLNLLVGDTVVPAGYSLPTIRLTYGDTPRAVCVQIDGTEETFENFDIKEISELHPIFLTLELPLPALKKISVMEVTASDLEEDQARAIRWASKRTDLAIWCTTAYDEREQRLWANAPGPMQDHALMLITHADTLKSDGTLQMTVDAVRDMCGAHVLQVLPIATPDALAARSPDGKVNKDKLRASGGIALVSAILKQVDLGMQSAADHIDFLLAKHGNSPELAMASTTPAEPAKKTPAAKKAAPAQAAQPAPAVQTAPAYEPVETATPEAPVAPTAVLARLAELRMPESEMESESGYDTGYDTGSEAEDALDSYANVRDYLTDQGTKMKADLQSKGKDASRLIMKRAAENVQWLGTYVDEDFSDDDPAKPMLQDAIMDATDMVQLMQSEKNGNGTLDTIALLTQLKNDFEARAND